MNESGLDSLNKINVKFDWPIRLKQATTSTKTTAVQPAARVAVNVIQ